MINTERLWYVATILILEGRIEELDLGTPSTQQHCLHSYTIGLCRWNFRHSIYSALIFQNAFATTYARQGISASIYH